MALLLAEPGPLKAALEAALGGDVAVSSPRDPDLFERALGQNAIVYAPAASLLAEKLEPAPDPERIRSLLSASNASGVRVLVAVLPEGEGYRGEIDAIRHFGTPFVIFTTPPLVEEVALALRSEVGRTLWVPERGSSAFATAAAVAHEAVAAIDTERQGRVIALSSEMLGPAALLGRAAAFGALGLKIRRVSGWLYRFGGLLRRWLGGRIPASRMLLERLFPELDSRPPAKALPAPQA